MLPVFSLLVQSEKAPVSYTHLSASDRDTHIGFFWGNSSSEDNMWHSFGSNNHISTITPKTSPSYYAVSYTHLDVYKRQGRP